MKAGDFASVTKTPEFQRAENVVARVAADRQRAADFQANLCENCHMRRRHHNGQLCPECWAAKQAKHWAEREREEREELTREFDFEVSQTETVRALQDRILLLERRLDALERQ